MLLEDKEFYLDCLRWGGHWRGLGGHKANIFREDDSHLDTAPQQTPEIHTAVMIEHRHKMT